MLLFSFLRLRSPSVKGFIARQALADFKDLRYTLSSHARGWPIRSPRSWKKGQFLRRSWNAVKKPWSLLKAILDSIRISTPSFSLAAPITVSVRTFLSKPLLNWDFQRSLCWIPYRHPRCPWQKIIFVPKELTASGSSLFLPTGFRTWSKKPLQPCWNKSVQSRLRLSGMDR